MKNIFIFCFLSLCLLFNCLSQSISWEKTEGSLGGSVLTILVDSALGIFVGTAEYEIFRSTNHGLTWEQLVNYNGSSVDFIFKTSNNTLLIPSFFSVWRSTNAGGDWSEIRDFLVHTIVQLADSSLIAGGSSEVYRSTDDGNNWIIIDSLNVSINSIVALNDGSLIAGTSSFTPGLSGIYRSTDKGESWDQVALMDSTVWRLYHAPSGSIFAYGYYPGKNYFWRSDDGGFNWEKDTSEFAGMTNGKIISVEEGLLFTGSYGYGILALMDNEEFQWGQLVTSPKNPYIISLALDTDGTLFAGTEGGGLYHSDEHFQNWQIENVFHNTVIEVMIIGPDDALYAGASGGVYRSTDGGKDWEALGPYQTTPWAICIDSSNNIFIASISGGSIWRRTDNGKAWTEVLENEDVYSLITTPSGSILAGRITKGMLRSTDNGDSWSVVDSTGVTRSFACNSHGEIFAAISGTGVLKSSDDGVMWTSANGDLYSFSTRAITICPDDYIYLGDYNGVFYSTNNGVNWWQSYYDIYHIAINSLAYNSLGHVIAASDNDGVFMTVDHGLHFNQINNGLDCLRTRSLAVDKSNYLYVGTVDSGLYRSVKSTDVKYDHNSEFPLYFSLSHNYPNPFNPSTEITYSIPKATDVTLKIYDLLGREVALLVNERKPAGEYTLNWNAAGLPGGVYFYRIVAGEFIETKKMVAIR